MDSASSKAEHKEPHHTIVDLSTATTTTTPDENLSSALSSLQIVHIEPVIVNEVNEAPSSAIVDLANDSDDVVVVDNPVPLYIELNGN